MRRGLRKATRSAEATERAGYDITTGTHGTTMPKSGEVPEAITPPKERPGDPQVYESIADPTKAYYSANSRRPGKEGLGSQQGWKWAKRAARHQEIVSRRPGESGDGIAGRPVVHHVEAMGTIDTDKNMNKLGTTGPELTADRLKVTDTEWIRRPDSGTEVGVQGTLPHVNWNQFAPPKDEGGLGLWNDENIDWNNNLLLRKQYAKRGSSWHDPSYYRPEAPEPPKANVEPPAQQGLF
jgi:hypothetical protein